MQTIQSVDTNYSTYIKNIYSKSRIVEFDEYVKKKRRFRHTELHWGQIPRANNPNKPLQSKAVNLLSTIVHKLRKNEVVTLNQNYLSRITNCAKDQNINLLKQIANVLDISFHAKIVINDKIHRNCYVIKHTQNGKEIIENAEVLLTQKHFIGVVAITPIEKPATADKKDSARVEFIRPFYIHKEKAFKKDRSCASALESNISDISNNIIPSSGTENIADATEEKIVAANVDISVETEIAVVGKLRNCPPANKRMKVTNSLRKARILKFRQYPKPKTLADMHPLLDQGMYDELRSESNRDFCNTFIEQTVLKMSKKPDIVATFNYRKGFVAYMGAALKGELHEAAKTNDTNFYYKANKTEAEVVVIKTDAQQKSFLYDFEDTAIEIPCPENQLKAKWACTLSTNQAYKLLYGFKSLRRNGTTLEVHLVKEVELLDRTKSQMLHESNAVGEFMGIESLEFVIQEAV